MNDNLEKTKLIYTFCQLEQIKQNELYMRWSKGYEYDKEMKYSKNHNLEFSYPGICCIKLNKNWNFETTIKMFLRYFYITEMSGVNCHIYDGVFLNYDDSSAGSIISNIKYKNTLSKKLIFTLLRIYMNNFYNKKDIIALKCKDVSWYEKIARKYKKKNLQVKRIPCIKSEDYLIKEFK